MVSVENPIRNTKISDQREFHNILKTLKLPIPEYYYPEKYEIYLQSSEKTIYGYIYDSLITKTFPHKYFECKYFEFMFVELENNFYIFEIKDFCTSLFSSDNLENLCEDATAKNLNLVFDFNSSKKNINSEELIVLKQVKQLNKNLKNGLLKFSVLGKYSNYPKSQNLLDKYSHYIVERIVD